MRDDFHDFVARAKNLDLPALIKEAEREAADAERRAHWGRGVATVRRADAQTLVRQLSELLYFLRFCAKPARVRPDGWLAYRPIAERLVASGQWKAEALKMFD